MPAQEAGPAGAGRLEPAVDLLAEERRGAVGADGAGRAPEERLEPDGAGALALPIETLGRDRGLDVEVRLETPGGTHPLGRIDGVHLQGRATPTLTATIPPGAPSGPATLVADLLEAGTADLVDVAREDLTLTP